METVYSLISIIFAVGGAYCLFVEFFRSYDIQLQLQLQIYNRIKAIVSIMLEYIFAVLIASLIIWFLNDQRKGRYLPPGIKNSSSG
jgi:hypothetical protein